MRGKLFITALLVLCSGCSKERTAAPTGVIDREVFIATYVDLRDGALGNQLKVLSDEQRERILREHGVTEEQLLAFAEAWGADTEYMTKVWDEVKARMTPLGPAPDSTH